MNDLIAAAKGHGGRGYGYSKLKREGSDAVALISRGLRIPRFERAFFQFVWLEAKRNRDPDNIAAGGRKIILDGLVKAGVLDNDGWSQVAGWSDAFRVATPVGVKVTIRSV